MNDRWHALLPAADNEVVSPEAAQQGVTRMQGAVRGVLDGLTFVVKDVFDVAGSVTGGGSPALRAIRRPATQSAAAVRSLRAAGASYVGRARSDELAYSLGGVNDLDGTPINPAAPGHTAGGSSSGSAAAVAGGLADIGLGTDTAGSIRVPASYCGLVGMRPTHGRVRVDGMLALAPSYDTVAWLTRDAPLAADVGRVLLDRWRPLPPPTTLLLATDLLPPDSADAAVIEEAWRSFAERLGADVRRVEWGRLDDWAAAFHVLRAAEVWEVHGEWLERDAPALSAAVAERIRAGKAVTAADRTAARVVRGELLARLAELIPERAAAVVPASAVRAPALSASPAELDRVRRLTLRLTTIASLSGAPSLAIPAANDGGLPFGVALIGRPGDDESLLAAAAALRGQVPGAQAS